MNNHRNFMMMVMMPVMATMVMIRLRISAHRK
jgi:hypothetical protein